MLILKSLFPHEVTKITKKKMRVCRRSGVYGLSPGAHERGSSMQKILSFHAKYVIIGPIMEVTAVRKHPFLNFNEQRALESIILRVISTYPMVRGIVLYGSKARGNFIEESDIDLLFITERALSRAMKFEISDAVYDEEVEHDVVVSAIFVSEPDFLSSGSSFLKRVRNEGIVLWSRE